MADNQDFLMRPIGEGMCKYESLFDGTLDLGDFARMNEYLDIKIENQLRYQAANKPAGKH